MMKLPKELTTVTPLSKYLAMILFLALPFVGFFLGTQYQYMVDLYNRQQADIYPPTIKRYPTPTPIDQTANWKTYTNNKYNFEFKYPPEFKVDNDSSKTFLFLTTYFAPGSYPLELSNGAQLFISVIENETINKAAEDLKLDLEKETGGIAKVTNLSPLYKTQISSKEVVYYTYEQNGYKKHFFLNIGDNKILDVIYRNVGSGNLKEKYFNTLNG